MPQVLLTKIPPTKIDMDVVGKTRQEQASEDALAASLGKLAYAIPSRDNRRSRFWFKMEAPQLEVIKEAMRPKELEHIDSEIVSRLDAYRQESPPVLQKHIEEIREFFLQEIAPKTLAMSGGTTQATEVIRRLLDTDVDSSTVARFQNMVNRATTLRMAMFVCHYFGLPQTQVDNIIGIPQASPPDNLRALLGQVLNAQDKTSKQVTKLWHEIRDRPSDK